MLFPSIFNDRFVTKAFDDAFDSSIKGLSTVNAMNADIRELDDSFQIIMDLPGYKKEDVKLELKKGYLVVEATRNETKEQKDEKGKYIRKERFSGSCQRSFYVGEDMTEEDVKAKFKEGVLNLYIPKKEIVSKKEDVKRIQIED